MEGSVAPGRTFFVCGVYFVFVIDLRGEGGIGGMSRKRGGV